MPNVLLHVDAWSATVVGVVAGSLLDEFLDLLEICPAIAGPQVGGCSLQVLL